MHSIWIVLIEAFLKYAASNSERRARLYLSWVSFLGPRFHRNSQFGMCKSKRETAVCSESPMYPATFLKRLLTRNFHGVCVSSLVLWDEENPKYENALLSMELFSEQ